MSGYSPMYILTLCWLLFLHLELIFSFFYKKLWLINLLQKKRILINYSTLYSLNIYFYYILFIYFIYFFFLKTFSSLSMQANYLNYLYLHTFLIFFIIGFANWYLIRSLNNPNKYIYLILQNLIIFSFFLKFCTSLILFLFILELFSVIYYFFFLVSVQVKITTKLQNYKNFILFYLWNSFFTTLFYGLGISLLVFFYGTVNFLELCFIANKNLIYSYTFIIISFFWKLGLPGFHFFKVELYKYLDSITVLFFSFITLYFNILLFLFFWLQPISIIFFSYYKFFFIFLFIFFYILIFFFKINNFYTFLAFSSLITFITILSIFLI